MIQMVAAKSLYMHNYNLAYWSNLYYIFFKHVHKAPIHVRRNKYIGRDSVQAVN